MNNEEMKDTELTDEQISEAVTDANEFIANMKEEVANAEVIPDQMVAEDDSNLEVKVVNTIIDPETGENKIIGSANPELDKSFDQMVKDINENKDNVFSTKPLDEGEVIEYLSDSSNDSILSELSKDTDLSNDAIRELLVIVNRRIKGEEFNVYRESPQEVKDMIDNYISMSPQLRLGTAADLNRVKKLVAQELIDEFANNIQMNRVKNDFAKEMESIYSSANKEISEAGVELIEERNKEYRKAAENIEDPEKKEKLLSIIDAIDRARDLAELKEFAKRCKIKKFDLEKPEKRIYNEFLQKYRNSTNNIYDINLAKKVLKRHFCDAGIWTVTEIDLFLICFCKYVRNFSPEDVLEHAFMYYVLYYCAMLDGDKSDIFKNNIIEVVENVKARNNM